MRSKVCIPTEEYGQRIERAAKLVTENGYDLMIANSNEADFANVRYFSGYWPLFEIGGVAIAPSGKVSLMIGPESETTCPFLAVNRSQIQAAQQIVREDTVGQAVPEADELAR